MSIDLDRIPSFFASWIAEHGSKGPCGEVATWLASGELEPAGFSDIVRHHGAERAPWFRIQVMDLVLDYAKDRLSHGLLTIDDISDVTLLKRALHIREGEFFKERPAEVAAFLQSALEDILVDERIDAHEELHLVGLQAAFDLSYDQFLALSRVAFERAMADLDLKLASADRAGDRTAWHRLGGLRSALEPTYWLATQQHRTLGALF